jgi:DNA-binding response OmpR family regulator
MKPSLLIADRDLRLCDMYRQCFTNNGYDVDIATGGLDCLARLRAGPVSALILDLDLPWGGGDGVLAWLRDEPSLPRPPVVLLTSENHQRLKRTQLGPPVVGCFQRPCSVRVLLACVESAVGAIEAAG